MFAALSRLHRLQMAPITETTLVSEAGAVQSAAVLLPEAQILRVRCVSFTNML